MSVLGTSRPGPRPPHGTPPSERVVDATASLHKRKLDPQTLGDHIDRLYLAARALCGSRENAEDLVQETFARVLARPRTVNEGGERAYLMRALRNTFYSRLRTASRRPRETDTLDEVTVADPRVTGQPERAVEVSEIFDA